MSECPYCGGSAWTENPGERKRIDFHTVVECDDCSGNYVRHLNGRSYPLADRTDPDADAVSRVLD